MDAHIEIEKESSVDDIEVSVVIPCLNEERTLRSCIRLTLQTLKANSVRGEVIVADNGSTDLSQKIAIEERARLVTVAARGYGNTLYQGFKAARGQYLIFLDADMSYDFTQIPRYLEKLKAGADLVMGSRFRGKIASHAMPFLHRYLGTPVLTTLANLFFGSRISDINCGMRGLRKKSFEKMGLRAGGMEFASEMLIKSSLLKMIVAEVPTDLYPDRRQRKPHLRSFRDGWRHLRFMLLFCPTWLFFIPGLAMAFGGVGVITAILFNFFPYAGLFTCLISLAGTSMGVQMMILGIMTRRISHMKKWYESNDFLQGFLNRVTLEKGLLFGLLLLLVGGTISAYACLKIWRFMHQGDYYLDRLDLLSTKLALLGTTLMVTGIQIIFSSFFLSLFTIETVPEQPVS